MVERDLSHESIDQILFIYPGNSFLLLEWTLGTFTLA